MFRYKHRLGFLIYLHVGNILELSFWCIFSLLSEEKHCLKKIFLFTEHLCYPLQVGAKICENTSVCWCWWLRPAVALQPSAVPQGRQATTAGGVRVQGSYTGPQQGRFWSEIFKKNYSVEEWRIFPDMLLAIYDFLFPQHICFDLESFSV